MGKHAEYADLVRAEKNAKKKLKEMNYRETCPACCFTCAHSERPTVEDSLECALVQHQKWTVGNVYDMSVCDKYKKDARN